VFSGELIITCHRSKSLEILNEKNVPIIYRS
jgi:hypothetical protein